MNVKKLNRSLIHFPVGVSSVGLRELAAYISSWFTFLHSHQIQFPLSIRAAVAIKQLYLGWCESKIKMPNSLAGLVCLHGLMSLGQFDHTPCAQDILPQKVESQGGKTVRKQKAR